MPSRPRAGGSDKRHSYGPRGRAGAAAPVRASKKGVAPTPPPPASPPPPGCDDDGEDAAGGRLLHLLQLAKAENVVVVVSRWFGGVLLGPSRFGLINNCARELLVKTGFVAGAGGGGADGGGGGGGGGGGKKKGKGR